MGGAPPSSSSKRRLSFRLSSRRLSFGSGRRRSKGGEGEGEEEEGEEGLRALQLRLRMEGVLLPAGQGGSGKRDGKGRGAPLLWSRVEFVAPAPALPVSASLLRWEVTL
jgi:hypothetical protein